ncbi:CRISPR-associated protein Csx20 [Desulfonema magnum]|uniref:CRISPR-associated protein n=1 Tax=Desulfonema magnum TaxID=45655 RepID=A0A975BVN5_9BACT|nr:CRISPR-associated protein Csx20 [Desulfonema magnum]QTA92064.1 Uncharacterized protein dnm_081380 [Desulfonema magnum]
MKSLFLIFNHQLTREQESDARTSLGVGEIITLPSDLKELWGQIPPHLPELGDYLEPVRDWLAFRAKKGDYVLIQGDFGACFIMVSFAFEKGLIPVYATTKREALEVHQEDGTVKMTHQFRHQIFRKYRSE